MSIWKKFYEELFYNLVNNYDSKSLLILAQEIFSETTLFGVNVLKDRNEKNGVDFKLEEFDPLSFISVLKVKSTDDKILKRLVRVKKVLNLESKVPDNNDGIPTTNPQQKLMFAFKYERGEEDFKKLWKFSRKLVSKEEIIAEDIDDVLSVNYTGLTKLTSIMFCVAPDRFMPTDKPSREFLSDKSENLKKLCTTSSKYRTGLWYINYLKLIKNQYPEKSFYEISYDAWVSRNQEKVDKDTFNEKKYWIWQGNHSNFPEMDDYLRNNKIINWSTNSHINKIKVGDKGVIYKTGKEGGVIAFLEVIEKPEKASKQNEKYKKNHTCKLRLTQLFLDDPINKNQIDCDERLSQFKGGSQGTNFKMTKKEYFVLSEKRKCLSKENYWLLKAGGIEDSKATEWIKNENVCISFDKFKDCTGLSRNEVFNAYSKISSNESERKDNTSFAFYQFYNEIKVGDKVIIANGLHKLSGIFEITAKAKHCPERKRYWHVLPAKLISDISYNVKDYFTLPQKTLTQLKPKSNNNHKLIVDYYDFDMSNESKKGNSKKMNNKKVKAKNIVYYGPPGTGKTHKFQEIIKSGKYGKSYDSKDSLTQTSNQFNSIDNVRPFHEMTLRDVICLVLWKTGNKPLKISEIYQHEFMQRYYSQKSAKTPRASISSRISHNAVREDTQLNPKYHSGIELFKKYEDSKWALVDDWSEYIDLEQVDIEANTNTLALEARYEIVTFHPNYSYEDFIEGIRPDLDEDNSDLRYKLIPGVFRNICSRAARDPHNRYALFIDELNRGNVAKIFGELITLIEPDKRYHSKIEPDGLTCQLPLSKERFGVPPNLDIYASMNTSDRSVTILDMALRRRFEFVEFFPNYELIEFKSGEFILANFVESINKKITCFIGRDFQLGHSYFMPGKINSVKDLKDIWFRNIMPLLDEYFFGNFEQLHMILGKFVFKPKLNVNIENSQYEYKKINQYDDVKFVDELLKLQNNSFQINNDSDEKDEDEDKAA